MKAKSILLGIVIPWAHGIRDALNIKTMVEYLVANKEVRTKTIYSVFLSMMILALALFEERLLKWMGTSFLSSIVDLVYNVLIVLPLFVIIFVLVALWWGDIVYETINYELVRKGNIALIREEIPFSERIYNEVVRMILGIGVLLEVRLIRLAASLLTSIFAPFLSGTIDSLIVIVHKSFWLSFLCFEYKWGTDSILFRNISFFERHYFYFSGFGTVFLLATRLFRPQLRDAIELCLFPFFLMMAIQALPVRYRGVRDKKDLRECFGDIERESVVSYAYDEAKEEHPRPWNYFFLGRLLVKLANRLSEQKLKSLTKRL